MGVDQLSGPRSERPLNVLILYDRRMLYTNTVREHVESFSKFSRHRITYAHAAAGNPLTLSFDPFDVIVVHYSIRLAYPDMVSPEFAWALKPFRGLKALFIQDEYDHTWRASQWIEQLGINLVFTCVPAEHVRTIYSKVDHDRVTFVPTLTGYVPTDSNLEKHFKPLAERRIAIGYRGRPLPFHYGRLAREKLTIGVRMKAECAARGVPCDIEWTEDKRIYGSAWVDFIASCRTTLGTESGANVFDFDGTLSTTIAAAIAQNPKISFEEVEEKYLAGRDIDGAMNQVSPRLFEAAALRTGLVLFEGTYSGVVRPDEHYISLRKDFSNVDEVLKRIQDDRELEAMTDRAYRHVIESGLLSYRTFVHGVDETLARHATPQAASAPSGKGWTREPDLQEIWYYADRSTWRGFARRMVKKAYSAVYRSSGLRKLLPIAKQLRGTHVLGLLDPVLRDGLSQLYSNRPREFHSSLRAFRERLRFGFLRMECRNCPSIHCPVWTSIRYDSTCGRISISSHPVHFLPPVIASGDSELSRALDAIEKREVHEIVWEHPLTKGDMGKLGILKFILSKDVSFRFTTLERLADLDPGKAARVLKHVATGVRAISTSPAAEATTRYRQAS